MRSTFVFALGLISIFNVWAQVPAPPQQLTPPKTESSQIFIADHRWVTMPPRSEATTFFTNIKNNDNVVSPFVVQFGMGHWGVAPAEHKHARTGHHHLLINTPLPKSLTASLPFNKNYIHFGKGQIQTVVNLPVGKHTLRLLLADHNHVPHYVFSEEITVNVTAVDSQKAKNLKTIAPELSFPNLKDGSSVPPTFKVQFHAAGLNVSNKLTKLAGTGFFQLKIVTAADKIERIAFPGGQTQTWLKLPNGNYKLQLEFVKNPSGEISSVLSQVINIKVAS